MGGPTAVLAFGQRYVWDNGLAVTAGRPVELDSPERQDESGDGETTSPPDATSGEAPAAGAGPADASAAGASGPSDAPTAEGSGPSDEGGAAATTPSPTPTMAPGDAGAVVAVDIVLVNGTDEPINSSVFVAMTSGGADAPAVYDRDAGLTGPPGTMLQPGQRASFRMGFEARDPVDLTMEIRPAYHYVSALFVHPAGAQG